MSFENIKTYCQEHDVSLVAVSKTKPKEAILELYEKGQRIFGENRVQELVEKNAELPKDIKWHFIGHLQRNKVKQIAPFVDLIHSADSLRLIREINTQAEKHDRVISLLLQFHIATEESKYGLDIQEAQEILGLKSELSNVNIVGVMGMATFTDNLDQVRKEFKQLKQYFEKIKSEFMSDNSSFRHISMGMSGDYKEAIAEGSNMIRIGTLLFGARN